VDVLHLCNVFTACVQCIRARVQFRHVCVDVSHLCDMCVASVLHLCDVSSAKPTCNAYKVRAMCKVRAMYLKRVPCISGVCALSHYIGKVRGVGMCAR